ncbi:MAG: hypothetical protein ABJF04_25710 [Reichenbachiella sp.]|uniref:hypothetical protein n=1 Tax=Reichenbachiella sp. TaxID=2184521 RepID=UPI003263C0A4
MKELQIKVHLMNDSEAPFQLEYSDDDVVILEFVKEMKDATQALEKAISKLRASYDGKNLPQVLIYEKYRFLFKHEVQRYKQIQLF